MLFARLPAGGISSSHVLPVKILREIVDSQDLVGQRVLRNVSIPFTVEGAIRLDGPLGYADLSGGFSLGPRQVFRVSGRDSLG